MRRADLIYPVVIQSRTKAEHASGAKVPGNWVTYLKRRAAIEYLSGSESTAAGQENADIVMELYFVRCSKTLAIAHDMQIIHDGRVFDIRGPVMPAYRGNEFVKVQVIERV